MLDIFAEYDWLYNANIEDAIFVIPIELKKPKVLEDSKICHTATGLLWNVTFSDTSSTYLEYPTDVAIADIDHNMYALVSNYAGSSIWNSNVVPLQTIIIWPIIFFYPTPILMILKL